MAPRIFLNGLINRKECNVDVISKLEKVLREDISKVDLIEQRER